MTEHPTLSHMQAELCQSQQRLLTALKQADDETLYRRVVANEWTLAENLVHVAEARTFFSAEIQKVLTTPGSAMGRTIADHNRIEYVREHGRDTRETIYNNLVASYERVSHQLAQMSDDDLQKVGTHIKYGPQALREFIDHFVVEHDQAHVQQIPTLHS